MLCNVKNVGDAQRIVYDRFNRPAVIKIGATMEVDLSLKTIEFIERSIKKGFALKLERLEGAEQAAIEDGDFTNDARRPRQVAQDNPPPPPPPVEVKDPTTPAEVLAKFSKDGMSHNELIKLSKEVLGKDAFKKPRPSREDCLKALRKAAAAA